MASKKSIQKATLSGNDGVSTARLEYFSLELGSANQPNAKTIRQWIIRGSTGKKDARDVVTSNIRFSVGRFFQKVRLPSIN